MPTGHHGTVAPHGTRTRYDAHGCRCDDCREAAMRYQSEYRRRRRIAGAPPGSKGPQVEPKPPAILSSLLLGDWADEAACAGPAGRGVDFHPSLGTPVTRRRVDDDSIARARRKAHRALSVCAGCQVVGDCLRAALAMPVLEDFGVWGGSVEAERVLLRRRRVAA